MQFLLIALIGAMLLIVNRDKETIRVKVEAGAKKERVEKDGNVLRIAVREPAERNMANHRIRQILAEHFNVSIKDVRIVSGLHRPNKRIQISQH